MQKKGSNRRTSQRLSKKPRIQVVDPGSSTDEDSSDEDDTPRKRKSKNGVNKKPKVTPPKAKPVKEEKENENDSDFKASASDSNSNAPSETNSTKSESKTVLPISRGIHRKFIPKTIYSEDYAVSFSIVIVFYFYFIYSILDWIICYIEKRCSGWGPFQTSLYLENRWESIVAEI